MTQVLEDPLSAGRDAVQRYAWKEAYKLLSQVDGAALAAEDLENLAEAAWWTGKLEEAIELRARAFAQYEASGEPVRAALVALQLADDFVGKGSMSVANGWISRAERLFEGNQETAEYAWLLLTRAHIRMLQGDIEGVLECARAAHDHAKRLGDDEAQAFALVVQGRGLVLRGEIAQGLCLLDEGTAVALAGRLRPRTTGIAYCMMIASCQGLGDYRRASEWTAEANKWCDKQDITGFPGICRVHRAEAMRLRGDWTEAEKQAAVACEEVGPYNTYAAASGFYEIGEIRRRRGDFAAAEEAYRKAKELGRPPEPGLSLLRLAQGKVEAAASGIKRALAAVADPAARGRRLPAQVEIAIEAGELKLARDAAAELETLVESVKIDGRTPPALEATARAARGQISLADGDVEDAAACFEEAARLWIEVGAPYEEAHARMQLGLALRRVGDEDGARDELTAARTTLERLGAVLDAQRISELLGEASTERTFMFTDVVDSTKLVEALGEEKWRKLLAWHDKTLRELITERGGEVIKQTGDGYFAAFQSPRTAIEAAVAIQRALDAHEPIAPDVRIGVHTGGAFHRSDDDYAGQGVHMAARIGAQASGGEILASSATLTNGGSPFAISERRRAELKGFEEPVELLAIDWR